MNTPTQQTQSEIRNNLFTMFEIDKLPEAEQEETLGNIGSIIFQSVLLRVLPLLSEEDLEEYTKLADEGGDAGTLLEFFLAKIPNFMEIMAEESENFRNESQKMLQ